HSSCVELPPDKDGILLKDYSMFTTGILLAVGTAISLLMTLDFIRPLREHNPY
ncbi:MAG: hypothetical protein HUU20_29585, partial [Pirellulales bacterium]|nr:hypothetical protein [Pirellulales bacterium]